MATAIKIYSVDNNDNFTTKTVSNANPEASDYVLKNFSQKLVSLSNNAFSRAERIDTKDITSATNSDGNITGAIFKSSSPFFSDDSDTFTAAVSALGSPASGSVIFQVNKTPSGEQGAVVRVANWQSINSLTNLINFINYSVTAQPPSYIKEVTFEKVTNGILGYNNIGYTNHSMRITGGNEFGIAIVNSLYENRIEVEGYNVTYSEGDNEVNIRVNKSN